MNPLQLVPKQEAITNATNRILNPVLHLSRQDVSDLLQVTLHNMYFSFRDQVFRQREAGPTHGFQHFRHTGHPVYGQLETIALSSHLMISPYKRYVDDIYLQTANEETADHFHDIINNVLPNLKFEIEKPEITSSGLSLSLLDFKVTISKDGNSSFEFYKKPAKKPLFVHHQSAMPTKSKHNFIRNERKRIKDRCSSNISAKQHLNTFDDILRLNGYPGNSIEQTKRPQNPQRNPPTWQHRMVIS